jgi:hypothetical protein
MYIAEVNMSSNTISQTTLAQQALLIGEKEYCDAIHIVLNTAQQQLLIFDQDLKRGDFASPKTANALQAFLSKSATTIITIILQDTRYLKQSCPRLHRLLQTYSHKMTLFETNQTVKHAKDCFIVADGAHYVRRIHIDQARFRYALNDTNACEQLKLRFDALHAATHYPLAVTQLGL